jgi:hypothetical protein
MRHRLVVSVLLVMACGPAPRTVVEDPDRPDLAGSLPVQDILGKPTTSPAFVALESKLQRVNDDTGRDHQVWEANGKDFRCTLTATRASALGLSVEGFVLWRVRCEQATPAAGAVMYPGKLPYALDWSTSEVGFHRRIMIYGHPQDVEGDLYWQGKGERDPSLMGRPLPAVDAFELNFRYSRYAAGVGVAPPPPTVPENPPDAWWGKLTDWMRERNAREVDRRFVPFVPAPGTNAGSVRWVLSTTPGSSYMVVAWVDRAATPNLWVHGAGTKRAPDNGLMAETPLGRVVFVRFMAATETVTLELSATDVSVHTRVSAWAFRQGSLE